MWPLCPHLQQIKLFPLPVLGSCAVDLVCKHSFLISIKTSLLSTYSLLVLLCCIIRNLFWWLIPLSSSLLEQALYIFLLKYSAPSGFIFNCCLKLLNFFISSIKEGMSKRFFRNDCGNLEANFGKPSAVLVLDQNFPLDLNVHKTVTGGCRCSMSSSLALIYSAV